MSLERKEVGWLKYDNNASHYIAVENKYIKRWKERWIEELKFLFKKNELFRIISVGDIFVNMCVLEAYEKIRGFTYMR